MEKNVKIRKKGADCLPLAESTSFQKPRDVFKYVKNIRKRLKTEQMDDVLRHR
jgi:hypothetical protein